MRFEPGDTLAAALWRSGVRVLSRGMRFHRPRGYFCGAGACNQCFVRVDGVPNTKACLTPCGEGARVESQNAWPSAERDVWRLFDYAFRREMDVHASFLRPAFLQPFYQRVIRAFAGLGRLPSRGAWKDGPGLVEKREADVLVVGGGPSGLSAAREASESGAAVTLLEQGPGLGGRFAAESPPERAAEVTALGHDVRGGAEVLTDAVAIGRYPDGTLAAVRGRDLVQFTARALVLAPGGYENESVFENNDLPGVMTVGAGMRLLHRGVQPGRRVLVAGPDARGAAAALDVADASLSVHVVGAGPGPWRDRLHERGVPLLEGSVVRAHGRRVLRGVTLSTGRRVACDALLLAEGVRPAPELFQQAGCRLAHSARAGGHAPVVDERRATSVPGVFAAGTATGAAALDEATLSGRVAGASAAIHAGFDLEAVRRRRDRFVAALAPPALEATR